MLHRWLVALIASVALCGTSIAWAAGDRVYLDFTVNGVAHDPTFAVLNDNDVLMPLADLQALGVKPAPEQVETDFNTAYVSLHALSTVLTYTVDPSTFKLAITLNGSTFKPVAVNLSQPAPAVAEKIPVRGVVVDYGVFATKSQPLTGAIDARWNINGTTVFETTEGRGTDGAFHRALTSLTFDDPNHLVRAVAGDAALNGGPDFGGSAVAGGASVYRAFDEDPYLITFPLPAAQTTVLQPSIADFYVNGNLVKSIDLAPGTYDLQNLPLQTGLVNAKIVVRNSLGQNVLLNQTTYASASLLRQGLSDFNVGVGAQRLNIASIGDTYGSMVAAGFYRLGLTPGFTAGVSGETLAGQSGAGLSLDGLVPFGLVHAAVATSRTSTTNGNAATVAFSTSGPRNSLAVQYRTVSPSFTALGLSADDDRTSSQWALGVNSSLSRTVSLSATLDSNRYRDAQPNQTLNLSLNVAARDATIVGQFTRTFGNALLGAANTISLLYSRRFGASTTASIAYAPGTNGSGTSLQLQHTALTPLQTSYNLIAEASPGVPIAGDVHVGLLPLTIDAHLSDSLHGGTFDGSLNVQGAVVATGGMVLLSQPVEGAYGVLSAPGVPNAIVYANNIPVGKTDAHGNAVLPSLAAYQANNVGLSTSSLPFDHIVEGANRSIMPGYRGGALARFASREIHDVTGIVRAGDGPVAYGQVDVLDAKGATLASSPTDGDGRFDFQGVTAGTYGARVSRFDGKTCTLKVTIPAFTGLEFNLGSLTCTP